MRRATHSSHSKVSLLITSLAFRYESSGLHCDLSLSESIYSKKRHKHNYTFLEGVDFFLTCRLNPSCMDYQSDRCIGSPLVMALSGGAGAWWTEWNAILTKATQ